MNERQKELLNKKFNVKGEFNITRYDFESFPCPLMAWKWSDEQMSELAEKIRCSFDYDGETFPLDDDDTEDYWYKVIEDCAVGMGMVYYEDLSKEEYIKQKEEWSNIK